MRIAASIEYAGQDFYGWQKQPDGTLKQDKKMSYEDSVEAYTDKRLSGGSKISKEEVKDNILN